MKYLVFLLFLLMIQNVYAYCNEGEININTASERELDKLYGIGPVKAKAIIDSRSFESIDDLIDTNGIGEITLQKIKEQGLACIDKDGEKDTQSLENLDSIKSSLADKSTSKTNDAFTEKIKTDVIRLNTIILSSPDTKDIKTEDNEKELEEQKKNNYAIYGFVGFCVLLGFLFIIKRNRFKENEFR